MFNSHLADMTSTKRAGAQLSDSETRLSLKVKNLSMLLQIMTLQRERDEALELVATLTSIDSANIFAVNDRLKELGIADLDKWLEDAKRISTIIQALNTATQMS